MAQTWQGSRDSNETAVETPSEQQAIREKNLLKNPLQTPAKSASGKPKNGEDAEATAHVEEKTSISDSSIKVKQLSWQEAALLMFT